MHHAVLVAYASSCELTRARITGTPKEFDVTGDSGKINKHHFCPNCGSSLYTKLDLLPDVTIIKAGTLDGGAAHMGGKVSTEYYCKSRVKYLAGVDGATQEPVFG